MRFDRYPTSHSPSAIERVGAALREWPAIIQGGMGIAISHWPLARAVSLAGQLGVVSGTSIDTVLLRRLQDGDVGGHMRRALAASPWPDLAEQVISRYFRPDGRMPNQPYLRLPLWTLDSNRWQETLAMLGGFVEVWLAKSSHAGRVGINLLTKVALPNLAVLYGAMQANVDVVLMGAGIPREIPGALDRLAAHEPATLRCEVAGMPSAESPLIRFDPRSYASAPQAPLRRPAFFPIIASFSLALLMARKASGRIQGFVIEGPNAGGHNAPPRGPKRCDAAGQPVYDERDAVDLEAVAALGYPFWLAGGFGSPDALDAALAQGAAGIQVGTLFAYCAESGMTMDLKKKAVAAVRAGSVSVRTDPDASPTGYPFKVADIEGTLSAQARYEARERVCDLGYLREAYLSPMGEVGFRCAAEPVDAFVSKGGRVEDTAGRKCLCNGLMATAGFAQRQSSGTVESPIVTSGDAIGEIRGLLTSGNDSYSAQDVIDYLTRGRQRHEEG
ncbi:MAG: nitronate monooxygenase [Bacilli bacterium]